jgi:hypothetical protein
MLSDMKDFISDFTKRSSWAARARQFSSDCAKFERVRMACIDSRCKRYTQMKRHAASCAFTCDLSACDSLLLHTQYLKQLDSLAADVDRFVGTPGRQAPARFSTECSTDRQTQIAAEETDRATLELKVKHSAPLNEPLSADAQEALNKLRSLGEREIDLDQISLQSAPLGNGRHGELCHDVLLHDHNLALSGTLRS